MSTGNQRTKNIAIFFTYPPWQCRHRWALFLSVMFCLVQAIKINCNLNVNQNFLWDHFTMPKHAVLDDCLHKLFCSLIFVLKFLYSIWSSYELAELKYFLNLLSQFSSVFLFSPPCAPFIDDLICLHPDCYLWLCAFLLYQIIE